MTFTISQSLCVECGLCCGGMVFDDVELRDEHEALTVECLGLEVEEEDAAYFLIQPCRALKGTHCSVYEHRPECCRSFECLLLKDYKDEKISKVEALDLVQQVREKMEFSDKGSVRHLIRKHFLGWAD